MSVTTLRLIPFSPAKLGDWDHSLRSASKMSQNRFATYLGIPVANIQHWEQGVATPPNYLISLISRVMKYDGYTKSDLTPAQVDAIRQTQATLALEGMTLTSQGLTDIQSMLRGEISREQFQDTLKNRYMSHASD